MDEHSEILPLLAAYHDGELAAEAEAQVRAHLESCSDCQSRLADWQALDRALVQLPDSAPDRGSSVEGALAKIRPREPMPAEVAPPWTPTSRRRVIWMAAAAAVLVIAVTVVLLRLAQKPTPHVDVGTPQDRSLAVTDSQDTATPPQAKMEPAGPDAIVPATGSPSDSGSTQAAPDTPAPDRRQARADTGTEHEAAVAPAAALAHLQATAPVSVGDGDTGIPHYDDWPARLYDSLDIPLHFRWLETYTADLVEINLIPEFNVSFAGVGYAAGDLLSPQHAIHLGRPIELSDETAYLVSNLRMEQAALMTRVGHRVVSAEVSLRLAEVTWRLANLTGDRDDVRSAIAAQTLAMRQKPELATQSRARVVHLQNLIR